MNRKIVAFGCAVVGILLGVYALHVGDLGLWDSWLVRRHADQPFDSHAWQFAGPADRGRMLGDLFARNRFVGRQFDVVRQLLGPSVCYVGYDDEPCYEVEYDSEKYRVAFSVNHSDRIGEIYGVDVEHR
jgi:hypothetical protein